MGVALPIHTNSEFWNTAPQDRVFRQFFSGLLAIATALALLILVYQVPPQPLLSPVEEPPAITRIQLERKPEPVIPKPAPEEPKPEPPKATTPQLQEPVKPVIPKPVAPPPVTNDRDAARDKVRNVGLAAVVGDLSALNAQANQPQASASKVIAAQGQSQTAQERLYAGSAQLASAHLSGQTSTGDLDARLDPIQTSRVTSGAGGGDSALTAGTRTTAAAGQRDEASVRRVFEQSKSSASALYNRALRANPTMSGRVTFEVVISPSGAVTSAKIVSSELNDPALERKLLVKVKTLQFGAKAVASLRLTYSYDFLPG